MSTRAFAYAWMLEDGSLCYWAAPTKDELVRNGKPGPGAKAVRVELVLTKKRLARSKP